MTPSDTRRSRRPCVDVEAATLAATGLPRYPDHLPDVLCPLPRRIETGACIGCFPARAAFPVSLAGRHPRIHFRGLLRLHSRYGPSGCSTAQGGLCHEASARLLHPTARQLPELPTTFWVDPSSTGHPRLFEAHSEIRGTLPSASSRIPLRSIRASVTGVDRSIPFCVVRSPGTGFCPGSALRPPP
jgi:hypothetical protein